MRFTVSACREKSRLCEFGHLSHAIERVRSKIAVAVLQHPVRVHLDHTRLKRSSMLIKERIIKRADLSLGFVHVHGVSLLDRFPTLGR